MSETAFDVDPTTTEGESAVQTVARILQINQMDEEARFFLNASDPMKLPLFGDEAGGLNLDSLVVTEIVIHLADRAGTDMSSFDFDASDNTLEKLMASLKRRKTDG